jgi:radical SAM/Cys-rich protein
MGEAGAFDAAVAGSTGRPLTCSGIRIIQANLGLRCNQSCAHCHLAAGPRRTECMGWPTMARLIDVADDVRPEIVDVTGGAPELNPRFRRFVGALRDAGHGVQVRTNLTALLEPEQSGTAEFLRERGVRLVGSLPCYLEENVDAQRGPGTYARSVEALRRLNGLGYGVEPGLPLNLVYNPPGPALPPEQASLENDYRTELRARFGIEFTRLLTITNMPLGRFLAELRAAGREAGYRTLLRSSFNPATIEALMCRHQISVGWDGTVYDCDFNLALGLSVDHGAPTHIDDFDAGAIRCRRVVTGEHCFGCTAGSGSSCAGALALAC